MARVRRSRALVLTFSGATAVIHNFLTRQSSWCYGIGLDLLFRSENWCEPAALLGPEAAQWIGFMIQSGVLVVEGTPAAALDSEYESFWQWGPAAGFYHFGLKDPPYMTAPQAAEWMQAIGTVQRAVPLYTTNQRFAVEAPLPAPDLNGNGPLSLMARRRSVRTFLPDSIPASALRDCLFAGFGITGFLDTKIEGSRELPLKMAPSGGARNPYEAYVLVQNVDGVAPGLYHYSAFENSLGLVSSPPPGTLVALLADQQWAARSAAGILLVANFDRTMWKYPNATAYRIILLEAGHIAQNITLAAAGNGLNSTPTAALRDRLAARLLGLNEVRQALVYAVVVGKGDPQAFEYQNLRRR